ncbi:MAG: FecR family protein [Croceitalea sp.]|nr:FecR family protein [Croceitalea sp.]
MQENYLAKWLNNELSGEELKTFKKSDEYATYMRILEASSKMEAPEFNVDQAFEKFKNATSTETPKVITLNPFKQFIRIAALIVLMLSLSYIYLNTLDETYKTSLAERTEVSLPDNSEIVLNADSKISFSEKKWNQKRNVELEGEAFFKVAKGKKFTVSTADGVVSVLGTQFNVENREGFFEVTCYEGLVNVAYNNQDIKLPAGSSFMVIDGIVYEGNETVMSQPSWMNNESTFENIPLSYVFDELERQFDIVVKTKNVALDQRFTGSFSNTDLNLALESIRIPSQINYKLENDNVLFYAGNNP